MKFQFNHHQKLSPVHHASNIDIADSHPARASHCGIQYPSMGSSSSKPVRSAAQAVSRRQYPKQPSTLPSTPSKPPSPGPASAPRPPKEPETKTRAPTGPTYHSKEQPSLTKSNGTFIIPPENKGKPPAEPFPSPRSFFSPSKMKQPQHKLTKKPQPSTSTAEIPISPHPSAASAPLAQPRPYPIPAHSPPEPSAGTPFKPSFPGRRIRLCW